MSKKRGKTNAPKARDEAKPETQAADAVRAGDQQPAGAEAEAAAGEPSAVEAGELETLSAGDPLVEDDADQGTQADLVTGGNDGEAAQAQGDGAQDTATQGAADPDGKLADLSAAPAGGDLEGDGPSEASAVTSAGEAVSSFDEPVMTPEQQRITRAFTAGCFTFGQHRPYATWDAGWLVPDDDDVVPSGSDMEARAEAAAAFCRAHPLAATHPETIVIHLRRVGFKDVPDATGRAGVAWQVFITALAGLDELAAEEKRARRDAEASAESVKAAQAFGEGLQGRGPFATSKGGPFDPTGFATR
jgi:hypothetical protein